MYYEDIVDTAVNNKRFDEIKNLKKTTADAVKKIDKNYEKRRLFFNNVGSDGKYYKYSYIDLFGSGFSGSKIRNAVTGSYYGHNYIVGSSYEDALFKVVEATGINGRREPLVLFYDTPEQYENHYLKLVSVPQKYKQIWSDRSDRFY
jgi:hypothetical protein